MRTYTLLFGKLREPVRATLYVESGFKNSYVAEAIFEETGEYLSETEVLQLEAQNADMIYDACLEYEESERKHG